MGAEWDTSDWHAAYVINADELISAAHTWDLQHRSAFRNWQRPPDDQVSRLLQGIFAKMNQLGYTLGPCAGQSSGSTSPGAGERPGPATS